MKRTLLLVLAALVGTALAEGVGLKAGLWEVTNVRQTTDGRDTTAQSAAAAGKLREQAMARMTPEQRKQMEMMGSQGHSASGPAGGLRRMCVSAAMAARDKPMVDPQGHCEPNKVNRSGNTTTYTFDCTRNGFGVAGKGEIVVAGETISNRVDTTLTDPRGKHTMHSETDMKYLGQDCQGIKPADDWARRSMP